MCPVLMLIAALLACTHVQAQHVTVTLRISITDRDAKTPVKNVKISIPRQGTNNKRQALYEIHATIRSGKLVQAETSSGFQMDNGVLVRSSTDFELTQTPHRLIVLADGFVQPSPIDLSNDAFKQALSNQGKVLPIPVELAGAPSANTKAGTTGANPTPSPSPSPVDSSGPAAVSSSFEPLLRGLISGLNYAFWVLGLLVFCLVSFWISLVLLAKAFQKDSIERRILRLAPLLAQGFVRPFGFRLGYFLAYKTELSPPEIYLRSINESLVRLLEPNIAMTGPETALQNINDKLAKLAGPNAAAIGIQKDLDGIKTSLAQLSSRNAPASREMQNYDSLKRAIMEAVDEALKGFKLAALDASSVSGMDAGIDLRPDAEKDTPQTRRDSTYGQRAKTFYQRLLDHQPLDCKVIYLEAVVKGSIFGKLADDNVYLSQVGSSQAPFVLFIDDSSNGTGGWVFPNPAQAFDSSTLKDVFPRLNEAQFNDAKEQIEPVVVRKVDERRWKVDRELGS
jgi:hypothetical protein